MTGEIITDKKTGFPAGKSSGQTEQVKLREKAVRAGIKLEKSLARIHRGECTCSIPTEDRIQIGMGIYKSLA